MEQVLKGQKDLVDTLVEQTGSMEEAKKIYAEFGLIHETAKVQTLIDGYAIDDLKELKSLKSI